MDMFLSSKTFDAELPSGECIVYSNIYANINDACMYVGADGYSTLFEMDASIFVCEGSIWGLRGVQTQNTLL